MRATLLFPFLVVALTSGACARLSPVSCEDSAAPEGSATAAFPLSRSGNLRLYGHSHNDYVGRRPLEAALASGLGSIEADLWSGDGGPLVGHTRGALVGSLRALYLDPLAREIERNGGSVYGDGLALTLWLDLKDSSPLLREQLLALLETYPFLTRYSAQGVRTGAVDVLLTGDWDAKRELVEATPDGRPFAVDSGEFEETSNPVQGPLDAVRAYAFDWFRITEWTGDGDPSPEDVRRVRCVARRAATEGRKLRLFNAPDLPSSWQFQLEQGAYFVGTDQVATLARFLEQRQGE